MSDEDQRRPAGDVEPVDHLDDPDADSDHSDDLDDDGTGSSTV